MDIHNEDYVPSAVPPAAVLAASAKARKPAKEGKLARQAKAARSGMPAAAALSHAPDDDAAEFVPPAAGSPPRIRAPQIVAPLPPQQPQQQQQHLPGAGSSPAKGSPKDWDDIDLGSPQP